MYTGAWSDVTIRDETTNKTGRQAESGAPAFGLIRSPGSRADAP